MDAFSENYISNPDPSGHGLLYFPRGFDPGKQSCPGCKHGENLHVAGMCYACGYCNWSILGDGNAYGVPAGWWHSGVLTELARRKGYAKAKSVFDRHGKLGGLRRARRHPAASRNEYRGRRAARDMARQVMGLRPEGVYRKDR